MTLREKLDRAAQLGRALQRSLRIQEIWPEAFVAGSVKTRAIREKKLRGVIIRDPHLMRPDGVRFDLTVEQYKELTR